MLYDAISKRLQDTTSQTRHQTILIACNMKMFRVVLQLQHHNYLNIIQSSNNLSLIEYLIQFMYLRYFFNYD